MSISLNPGDALLLVDIQNDFLPGGSLAVTDGDAIIEPANAYIDRFKTAGLPIYASRDFHPADHCSFAEHGGNWPSHCVANTPGAEFAEKLTIPDSATVVSKATEKESDAYSALQGTGFEILLKDSGIQRVFVCGLATDYCVAASAEDLLDAGFSVLLLTDAIRGVNINPDDSDNARKKLRLKGATEITLADLVP